MEKYNKLDWLRGLEFEAFKKEVAKYPTFLLFDIARIWGDVSQEDAIVAKRFYLYHEAAQRGDSRALTFMGGVYAAGGHVGAAQFYFNKAIKEYKDPIAMLKLGLFYRERERYEESFYWLDQAAKHNSEDAWLHLGYCYANGLGVERDLDMARKYYDKAIEKGDGEAMYFKAEAYLDSADPSSDIKSLIEECKILFEKASMHGCTLATEAYLSIF